MILKNHLNRLGPGDFDRLHTQNWHDESFRFLRLKSRLTLYQIQVLVASGIINVRVAS